MATIFTIHGTGATGPEAGSAWWQRGSQFEQDVRRLVESEDGDLIVTPLVWDGSNSENSRRAAAARLSQLVLTAEARQRRYIMIGHSHGGSVMAELLVREAAKGNSLPCLARWLTVGTPFIRFSKSASLFSRLGTVAKTAYITLLLVWLLGSVATIWALPPSSRAILDVLAFGVMSLMFLAPFLAFWLALRMASNRKLRTYRPSIRTAARSHFAKRWVGLSHENDEAIAALMSAKAAGIKLFPDNFAVSTITALSVFVLPISLLAVLGSNELNAEIARSIALADPHGPLAKWVNMGDMDHVSGWGRVVLNALVLGYAALYVLEKVLPTPSVVAWLVAAGLPSSVAGIGCFVLVSAALLWGFALLTVVITGGLARAISRTLSTVLNKLSQRQLTRLVYGSDALGEQAVEAAASPDWMPAKTHFPEELSLELRRFSDAALAQSVEKLRGGLTGDTIQNGLRVAEFLSWQELIHTAYFEIPRCRKLIAYTIARSDGFKATATFKSDPDYELIAGWFEQMVRTNGSG